MDQLIPSLSDESFYTDAGVKEDVRRFGTSRRLEKAIACKSGTWVIAYELLVDEPQAFWVGYTEVNALAIPKCGFE